MLYLTDLAQKLLSLRIFSYFCVEIAKSVRYNIFTNGALYPTINTASSGKGYVFCSLDSGDPTCHVSQVAHSFKGFENVQQ